MYEVGSLSNFIDTKKKKSEVKLESSLKTIFSDDTKSKFDRLLRPEEFQIKARIKKNETEADESSKKKRKYDDMAIEKKITPAPPDIDDRTLFVGNIPKTETSNTVRKLFEQFGEIISIRLRSLPIAGTAVDDAGNQTLVKKICANKNKLGEQKGSFNAYVVFKDSDSVTEALKMNNTMINKRHIRVDRVNPSLFDTKRTVFLGSLPHYADEEDLRNHFAKVLPNGHDDIESIRIIRDPDTLIGKGIGYILFTSREAVSKALTLNNIKFKCREIRVKLCGKAKTKPEKKNITTEPNDDKPESINTKKLKSSSPPNKTKIKLNINASNAVRRIQLKNVKTKQRILKERGQKKSKSNRNGKTDGAKKRKRV